MSEIREFFQEMKHFKRSFKIGDEVWILDGGKREKQKILKLFTEQEKEGGYKMGCCYTTHSRSNLKMFHYLDEVYLDEEGAKGAEERFKSDYDRHVTRP